MATLATYFRKDDAVIYREEAPARRPRRRVARPADPYRLAALPNEDVYFFCKRIDNSRLVRQADPRAAGECWSAIGAVAVLAVLLTGALRAERLGNFRRLSSAGAQAGAPAAASTSAARLEVEEATLLSPARLEQLARAQKLVEPAPGQVVHLDPNADGSLAHESARSRTGVHACPGAHVRGQWTGRRASAMKPVLLTAADLARRRRFAVGRADLRASSFSLQVVHHKDYARLARQQQELRGRDSGAARLDLRPQRPAAGHERPDGIGVRESAARSRPAASPPRSWRASCAWIAASCATGCARAYDHQRGFLWVKRKIHDAEAEQLRSLHLDWIEFQTESQRHYPNGTLAAHVLGSVDHEEKGNAGVELSLDRELRGRAGIGARC